MYKAIPVLFALSLSACQPLGPTEAEIAAHEAAKAIEKSCARLYGGQTKVFRDLLYKQQVPEDKVKFGDKAEYIKKCIDAGFTKEQMQCIDPNLRDDSCTETMKDVADKEKDLKTFLFSPMSGAADVANPAGDAPAGDAPAGDAPAGDAPADESAKPAGGE